MAEVLGTAGNDTLPGTADSDILVGFQGNDTLQAGDGSDQLAGNDGDDTLNGDDGNDKIWGGRGTDAISGGAGSDIADFSDDGMGLAATQGAIINLAQGAATDGWGFTDTITGIEHIVGTGFGDVLTGDINSNNLFGLDGADTLDGGNGDDRLLGGKGNDALIGGTGKDLAIFYSDGNGVAASQAVTVDLTQGAATDGWGFADTISGVEDLDGTSFGDTLIGDLSDNQLSGLEGDDTLSGGGGNDLLFGAQGNDTANGGTGNDLVDGDEGDDMLHGDAGDDDVIGGSGNDFLFGDGGDDFIWGAQGDDLIDGGAGYDTAVFQSDGFGNDVLAGASIDLAAGTAVDGWGGSDTLVSVERIYGTNFADAFAGDREANSFFGGGGDDTIIGGIASSSADGDMLVGGAGDDTIRVNNGFAFGELGNDRILGQSTSSEYAWAGVSFWGATSGIVANLTASSHGSLAGGNNTDGFQVSDGLGGIDLISDLHVIYGGDFDDVFYVDSSWTAGGKNSIQIRTGKGNDTVNFLGVEHAALSYWESEGGVRADLGLGTAADMVGGDSYVGEDTFSGVDYFYGSNFADIVDGSSTDDKTLHGEGGNDTINGLAGGDALYGGSGDDTLSGGTGNDWLDGESGSDNMRGGAGDDVYVVDSSSDTIDESASGSSGTDEVQSSTSFNLNTSTRVMGSFEKLFLLGTANISGTGNALNNLIGGNSGANTLSGNDGNDTLSGNGGNDTLSGGNGKDWLDGGAANDIMRGGAGDDVYVVDTASDTVDESASGSSGTDEVQSSISFNLNTSTRVMGSFEKLFLVGTANISGTGNALNNVIGGNSGANTLSGNDGNDALSGSGGNDTLSGGNGNDSLYGDAGNDTLTGGAGNDSLNGGAGNDIMRGSAGNDIYVVDTASDTIDESASGSSGTDEVQSSISFNLNTSTRVMGNFERLFLLGTANISGTGNALNNVIGGNSGANALSGSDGNDALSGNGGNDTLSGGNGNDSLYGDAGNDTLNGGAGNDWLDGGTGNDTMRGGAGNDIYVVNSSSDTIDEKASGSSGTDEVQSSISFNLSTSSKVLGNFEKLFLTGSGNISGTGNSLNNIIGGNSGANSLSGNAGNDTLNGSGGNDTLTGGTGNDILSGGTGIDNMRGGAGDDDYVVDNAKDVVNESVSGSAGRDTVHTSISFNLNASSTVSGSVERIVLTGTGNINGTGNSLSNTITGNSGSNMVIGNAGNDNLYGNGGNDRITGGAGNDQLAGGGGKDVFVFNAALSNSTNVDYIIDFVPKDDAFWLDNAVMKALGGTGNLDSSNFWKSTSGTAHDSSDRIIYDTDHGRLYYDSNGSASGGSMLIATLNPNLGITASDFVVI